MSTTLLPSPWRGEGREGVRPGKPCSANAAKCCEDSLNHSVGIAKHLVIPETNEVIALDFEKTSTAGIRCLSVSVLPAIKFHNEMPLKANEIDDKRADRGLAAESASIQLSAPQSYPQVLLGIGRIDAQFLGSGPQHP